MENIVDIKNFFVIISSPKKGCIDRHELEKLSDIYESADDLINIIPQEKRNMIRILPINDFTCLVNNDEITFEGYYIETVIIKKFPKNFPYCLEYNKEIYTFVE